ncbi:MAG: hydantoinase/oxoprolinase family protein [Rhodobacteraceae bacterium]|nr:hydantoinase/oxoprolinase family protein [Paracoccaceae bacterium]
MDIGGTFTDVVAQKPGERVALKVPSTPSVPELAVLEGITRALAALGVRPQDVTNVFHGTTVGSNTLLQRVGSQTGLITTSGFRDVLEIGRLRTPDMFNLTWAKPEPLVRRRHRLEVAERIDASGTVIQDLDEEQLRDAARFFISEGVEAVAICFINSYVNPQHEQRAAAILRSGFAGLEVSVSTEILPVAREYERTSTACVNAYVKKELGGYLLRLEQGIRELGVDAPIYVSNSNGGVGSIRVAREQPVFFISSGRSAGAVGAQRLGAQQNRSNLIAFDMGGTTASASLVQNGSLIRTDEYEFRAGISTPSRFIKAGGYLMRVPAIDVAEVGSGAGSIAHIDDGGLLEVGPRSAGAEPGPACYGKGGTKPTVTDANVALGYLSGGLAGSTLTLDSALSKAAIDEHIAGPLKVDMIEAAFGIRQIVTVNMARAIRAVTVERGVDPRDFDLLAFGGSGPVHACDLARTMGIERIVFPQAPGVFTATGLLGSRQEIYSTAVIGRVLSDVTGEAFKQHQSRLIGAAVQKMTAEGAASDQLGFEFELDLRFVEQDGTLAIPAPGPDDVFDPNSLRASFLEAYRDVYGYASTDAVEAVNLRLTCFVKDAQITEASTPEPTKQLGSQSVRSVYFGPDLGWQDAPVYQLGRQPNFLEGPAIVATDDSTIVIAPDFRLETGSDGSLTAQYHSARSERIAS